MLHIMLLPLCSVLSCWLLRRLIPALLRRFHPALLRSLRPILTWRLGPTFLWPGLGCLPVLLRCLGLTFLRPGLGDPPALMRCFCLTFLLPGLGFPPAGVFPPPAFSLLLGMLFWGWINPWSKDSAAIWPDAVCSRRLRSGLGHRVN